MGPGRSGRLTLAQKARMEWFDVAQARYGSGKTARLVDTSDGPSLFSLPCEVVDLILSDSSLNARDHLALAGTCRALRRGYDEDTWQAVFEGTGPQKPTSSSGLYSRFTSHLLLDYCGTASRRTIEPQGSRHLRTILSRGLARQNVPPPASNELCQWRDRVCALVNGCWVDRRTIAANTIKVPPAILGISASSMEDDAHLPKVWRLSSLESLCLKVFQGPEGYAAYVEACRHRGAKLKASGEKRELMQWEKMRSKREAKRLARQ